MELLRSTLGNCYRFLFPAEPSMERLSGSSPEQRHLASSSTPNMLNDHIYELYEPTEEPSMDILFFHGLQSTDSTKAYLSTWTCGDGSGQIWPSTWLVEEFPSAKVFSVSYDACMRITHEQGRFNLHNVAENLIQAIRWANVGHRPVILVGHSFGGLVIKNLLVKADHTHGLGSPELEEIMYIQQFLHNVGGVFFYGTPHRGSLFFDKAASFLGGPLLGYVKVLSAESARLDADFVAVCKKYGISRIASAGESLPTSWTRLFSTVVVPEASARYGDYCTVKADHITLCKPTTKKSNSFQHLRTFLQGIPKVQVEARQIEAPFENIRSTSKSLVGLDLAVKSVEQLLQENEKVGLVGMGGVGKTTLAMAVFNKLSPTFEYSCFILVMKLISGSVEDVKQEMWNCLHCHGKKVGDNYKRGSWSGLRGKRLLVVLDDISEKSDRDLDVLSDIARDIETAESRFIVTSRDGVLLNNMDAIYRVPFLDYNNAEQLFITHAFPKQAVAPKALRSSVKAVVEKCAGLPLTLELLGKYLHRKTNEQVWLQTLEDLDRANDLFEPDQRLWAQLRLSFNNLGKNEQHMFLDVTTFFTGTQWTLREAKEAWKVIYGSEERRWQTLLDMSLVYDVKEDEVIKVHEQLQSLGRKIASESKNCRAWNRVEALKLLQSTDESDDQQVHALRLECDYNESKIPFDMSESGGCSLKNVRYLDFQRPVSIAGAQGHGTFHTDQLVLLGCSDEQFGPLLFNPTLAQLAVLELSCSGYFIEHLPRFVGQLSALKILRIPKSDTLVSLPDEIGRLSQLECLKLLHCWNLQKLPESLGELSNLKHLEFRVCDKLETLPHSLGQLQALKCLKFEKCAIVTLPASFGDLPKLEHLEFVYCTNLHTLPDSFGYLFKLKHLKFHTCCEMDVLPVSFGHLSALEHLEFHNCEKLHSLPESFGQLSALESLEFHGCDELNDLPEFFGQLAHLQHLLISCCGKVERFPNSLADLKNLRHLSVECIAIKSIPDSIGTLPSLQILELGFLPWLEGFPPWLGEITVASPAMSVRRVFHVRDGCFALAEVQNVATYSDWILVHLLKNEVTDYGGALAALESWRHLHVNLGDLLSTESNDWIRILWKKSNLKLLTGDLRGALQDLDAAVEKCKEKCVDSDWMGESDRECLEYISRKQRGYARYMLDDLEGAREDGEVAFKYQSSITDLLTCERQEVLEYVSSRIIWKLSGGFGALESVGLRLSGGVGIMRAKVLDQPVLSYMNFTFLGTVEYKNNVELMILLHSRAMQKLEISDFTGALAHLSDDAIDLQLLGFRAQAFILHERGILKRLTHDLNGALDDLNSALELISNRHFKHGDSRFRIGYETLKHRGYVKFLLGDVDGARNDAVTAVMKLYAARKYGEALITRDRDLGAWIPSIEPRQVVDGWEVAEDETKVAEGTYFEFSDRRAGLQSLTYLGFNLIY